MRMLLDTHTFLWFVTSNEQLSENALDAIADPTNTIFVSPASYWEIAIKVIMAFNDCGNPQLLTVPRQRHRKRPLGSQLDGSGVFWTSV